MHIKRETHFRSGKHVVIFIEEKKHANGICNVEKVCDRLLFVTSPIQEAAVLVLPPLLYFLQLGNCECRVQLLSTHPRKQEVTKGHVETPCVSFTDTFISAV